MNIRADEERVLPIVPAERAERPRRRLVGVLLAVGGVLAASTMVWKASTAAFTATTNNGTNTFSSGTVALSDSDNGTAMFTAPPSIAPGDSGSACIRVTYGGSLAAVVKLYASSLTDAGGLGAYITMTVEEGTTSPANGAGVFDCTNFTPGTTIVTGTLASLGATPTTGYGGWAPTGSGQTKDYKFSWDFDVNAPDSVQNTTVSLWFSWEAQNT